MKKSILLSLILGSLIVPSLSNHEIVVAEAATSISYSTLYDSNGVLKYKGNELRMKLHEIIDHSGVEVTSYGGLSTYYKSTDVDPNNSSNVILYYTGEARSWDYNSFNGSINREHIWPQSRFGDSKSTSSPYSDVFNVRPCDSSLNSKRGNYPFDDITGSEGNIVSNGVFCPIDDYKGDVARSLFYVATRCYTGSSTLSFNNLELVDSTNCDTYQMGKLSTLLEWNLKYAVSDVELRRNEGGEATQKNRNPYIDHPEFAIAVWGDYNSNTRAVVDKYTYTVSFNSNGGSEVVSQDVLHGNKVLEPSSPIKDNDTFLGWYVDSSFTKEYNFDSVLTSDITLYAKWGSGEVVEPEKTHNFENYKTETSLSVAYTKDDEGGSVSSDYSFTFTDANLNYEGNGEGTFTSSVSANGFENTGSLRGVQFYNSFPTITYSDNLNNVSKVKITYSSNKGDSCGFNVYIGNVLVGTVASVEKINNNTVEFSIPEPLSGQFKIEVYKLEGVSSMKSLYFKNIEITGSVSSTTFNIIKADLKYGTEKISKNDYEEDANYGIILADTSSLNYTLGTYLSNYGDDCSLGDFESYLTSLNVEYENYSCNPSFVDENRSLDNNGEYFQFSIDKNNLHSTPDVSYTAVAYMELDSVLYLSKETAYSLKSIAEAYLKMSKYSDSYSNGLLSAIINL